VFVFCAYCELDNIFHLERLIFPSRLTFSPDVSQAAQVEFKYKKPCDAHWPQIRGDIAEIDGEITGSENGLTRVNKFGLYKDSPMLL
jgi:hypothetical protein